MTRRALLIGINRYQLPDADLRGCLNDVAQLRELLTGLHGFAERDIAVLADFEATTSAIQRGLEQLIESAGAGDVLLVHYSGHGSAVPDTSGDETDLRDEILCPTDLDWKAPLRDDWLRALFDTVGADVNLTVLMDCCHAGTNTRESLALGGERSVQRYLPYPLDLLPVDLSRDLVGGLRAGRARAVGKDVSDVMEVDAPEIVIAGSRDDETAAEALIGGVFAGALTDALVSTIREAKGKLSHRELHAGATRRLAGRFRQTPQLAGRSARLDRQLLEPFA